MKLLASLTNRIFIAASLLAIVTTGVAVYVVGLRATREAELELARGLAEAGDLVDQQQRALTAQSLLTARLLADLPKLKGAVETRHAETVAPIAADYRRQVAADLLVISDRDGGSLAAVPTGAGAPTPDAVTAALGGREVVEFRPDAGGVLQVATVPIAIGLESPDVLGTVSVGVRLDAQMAERFKRATRSEVAFTLDGTVRAATVPQSTWRALQPLLSQPGGVADPDRRLRVRRPRPAARSQRRWRRRPADGRRRRPGGAGAAVAHGAAGIPAHRLRRAGPGRRHRGAAGRRAQLRRRPHHHPPVGRHHGDDARGGDHRRPDAEDPVARAVGLAGRGRASAGDDLQHAHRFGGALSARGRRRKNGCSRSAGCRRSSRTRCATR